MKLSSDMSNAELSEAMEAEREKNCKTTLETSGEDVKLHSKRVEKM
jgi:hypothetical protein